MSENDKKKENFFKRYCRSFKQYYRGRVKNDKLDMDELNEFLKRIQDLFLERMYLILGKKKVHKNQNFIFFFIYFCLCFCFRFLGFPYLIKKGNKQRSKNSIVPGILTTKQFSYLNYCSRLHNCHLFSPSLDVLQN